MSDLLITFYADDLTGSTDALEVLSNAGARTLVFIDPPTAETLGRYPDLNALGVAGRTRSLTPEAMDVELSAAFEAFLKLGPRHIHYKVCSTFDSSPSRGSIGRAIDVGRRVIGSSYVPLLVAAPSLGRYCVFGHLYAAAGIGADRQVFRLDRHPSASNHPATPMRESDLRIHLSEQTDANIANFDLLKIDLPQARQVEELRAIIGDGAAVVLFDGLSNEHLKQIGGLVEAERPQGHPQFSVGSSGVESALGLQWEETGQLVPRAGWNAPEPVDQVLVVSGSCSPITQGQIEWARRAGFAEVALDTPQLAEAEFAEDTMQQPIGQVLERLHSGKSVVVHTSMGREDPRIAATREVSQQRTPGGLQSGDATQALGRGLGRMVRRVLEESSLERLCIAGGDTASWISREIDIEAIEMRSPLTLGAPLCGIHSPGSSSDGLEVVFKGGQVGGEDFFGYLLTGTAS